MCCSPRTRLHLCLATYSSVSFCVHLVLVILAGGVLAGTPRRQLIVANEDVENEVGNTFHRILNETVFVWDCDVVDRCRNSAVCCNVRLGTF